MKKVKCKYLFVLLACINFYCCTTLSYADGTTISPIEYNEETYYQFAHNKTGEELKQALHHIISHHDKLSYESVWDALRDTDEDLSNFKNVRLLYSDYSMDKFANGSKPYQWNREHVWAKSHGNFGTIIGPGTDLHNLRTTNTLINSKRGSLNFDEGGIQYPIAPGCKYTSNSWEPPDRDKGDIARMLFYMAVRYKGDYGEINLELNNQLSDKHSPYMGKLSTLLKWHQQDPVDAFEKRRNNIIFYKYQHNRNPFIDHPEWVQEIWEDQVGYKGN